MSLAAGERLGPYEILAPLGEGGMGQVYKARDTRLDRIVALKVSKREFTERFEREARAISALNHPHICQLYDVGPNFLVMEFAEGAPIKGPLPVEKALEYSRQILDALDHAHRHKITHRDLKPANIMITRQGVKLLDFGLAKLETGPLQETDESITQALTKQGQIVGTLQYMSPEQLQGKPADARSDIFSFGAVLYEMLSGKRAFEGSSAASVIAAVLERQPAPLELSPPLDRVIRACLEKDPDQRMQAAHDVKRALDWTAEPQTNKAESTAPRRSWLGIAVGLLLAAAAVLGWIAWRATRPVQHSLVRLDVDLGSDISLSPPTQGGSTVNISPDGTRLVYSARIAGGNSRLFTRRLDQPKAVELPGTEGAQDAFFSPDGQWIGFVTGTGLNKISVQGGSNVPLAEAAGFAGATWGEDDNIILSEPFGRGFRRIPAAGGSETVLAGLGNGERGFVLPQILPGDKGVLFTQIGGNPNFAIEVLTLPDHRRKNVIPQEGHSPHYLAVSAGNGYLLFSNKATLYVVPFDLDKMEARGTPVPILDDIEYNEFSGTAQFALSATGTLIYRRAGAGGGAAMSTIQWVDAAGTRQPLSAKPAAYNLIRFSPDGTRLAMSVIDTPGQDISVYDPQRDTTTRLTSGQENVSVPVWSRPDGKYIVFASTRGGLWWTRSDGAGQPQRLFESRAPQVPFSFTSDGKRLAYYELNPKPQIWTVPIQEDSAGLKPAGTPQQFLNDQFTDIAPVFSPDGHWLAYNSSASGNFEFYVRPFEPASGEGGRQQISNGGAGTNIFGIAWSHTGDHELYYQSGDQIMAVSYTVKGDPFVADKPRVWISKIGGTQWDLAPDGKRVAVITPVASAQTPQQDHTVVFLLNFLDYLKRQVPLNK
jgi:serine/threonine-protein kinase